VDTYYSRVPEPITPDPRLTEVAADLMKIFRDMPRQMPPATVRDLTIGQIRLLFVLRAGPQPMGAIAEVFDLSSTAATGFVDRVERHGLIARRHRTDDRRIVECFLTPDGERFLDGVATVRLDAVRNALAVLSPRQLTGFHQLVRQIIDRRDCPAPLEPQA
jgi:DNA-binding MarR family transcriptional regulator